MDFNAHSTTLQARIVALVSLLLGLNDAARLLGVQLGAQSPLEALGVTGFVYLAIFAGARLFAAVGLWIKASWGAVLLVGATGVEVVLYLLGNPDIRMTAPGFAVRLFLLAAMTILFLLHWRRTRAQAAD